MVPAGFLLIARRLILPGVAALVALPLLRAQLGYPWSMAWVTAVAIGTLAYLVRKTTEQLRVAYRTHRIERPDDPDPTQGHR